MSLHHTHLIINGQNCLSSSIDTFENFHPATGEHVGHTESASSADIRDAIDAASVAFPAWERVPAAEKRTILNKAADLLESDIYVQRFMESISQEVGMFTVTARHEAHFAATHLREAAAMASQIKGETSPSARVPGGSVIVQRRAFGVVFALAPFNSPINLAARATAIPLACGNTVVLKSSEVCPRTQGLFVEAMHEAGLPNGVLNLLHISKEMSPKLVSEIIAHPKIRHVNFTGSPRVGAIIAMEAGKNLKPCVLELGGKSAVVVLNDANVKLAARAIVSGAMLNSGQICMSSERVIVQQGVADMLIAELTSLASKIKAGPDGSGSHISGVFSKASADNIISLLREAQNDGAKILLGDLKADGSYVQPHVVLGYKPGMRAWKQETFGPVFGITVVDTVDEAVNLANETDFTLGGSLWTTSIQGIEIASRIRAGSVLINGSTLHAEPGIDVHGIGGNSGWGRFDVENFTQKHIIVINPDNIKFPLVDDLGL